MRHVFPTAEIPHKWAHATQDEARNAQGNLYFRGDTIYSYRDSWPLARIYRKADRVLVLTNSGRYSATTAKQQWEVNRAALHLPCAAAPYPVHDGRHSENLAYFVAEQERALKEAGRAMRESAVQSRAEYANRQHKAMADYMIFFGIRRKMPALLSFAAAFERARRIENPDLATLAKREAEKQKRAEREAITGSAREQKRQAVYAARRLREIAREIDEATGRSFYADAALRSNWRLFGAFQGDSRLWGRDPATMLRVNGEQIETSQGARVPLAAAPMVWNLVQRAAGNGGYAREGFKAGFTDSTGSVRHYSRPALVSIGDYPLDRIDADGTLHAGCHTIPYSELASMARQLGLV